MVRCVFLFRKRESVNLFLTGLFSTAECRRIVVSGNRHRGSGRPLSPATPPGHAGPHPAVRRIKLGPHDHGGKPKSGEVGIGQGNVQSGRVRESPGTVRTPGGLRRQVLADTPFAKLAKSCPSALPLLPHDRPESAA